MSLILISGQVLTDAEVMKWEKNCTWKHERFRN